MQMPFGLEGIDVRALMPNDVAGLTAAGITGLENIEVIDRVGEIIGINSPAGAFAISSTRRHLAREFNFTHFTIRSTTGWDSWALSNKRIENFYASRVLCNNKNNLS
ncbi:MAG TPA: hypothetical protein VGH95_01700 [Candidatus Aquirickettsiella sp.]|jgi:hypothetical protein